MNSSLIIRSDGEYSLFSYYKIGWGICTLILLMHYGFRCYVVNTWEIWLVHERSDWCFFSQPVAWLSQKRLSLLMHLEHIPKLRVFCLQLLLFIGQEAWGQPYFPQQTLTDKVLHPRVLMDVILFGCALALQWAEGFPSPIVEVCNPVWYPPGEKSKTLSINIEKSTSIEVGKKDGTISGKEREYQKR